MIKNKQEQLFSAAVGEKIQKQRKKQNLTLKEFAKMCHSTDSYFSFVENGKTTISIYKLSLICKALNCTPNDLLLQDEDNLQSAQKTAEHNEEQLKNSLYAMLDAYWESKFKPQKPDEDTLKTTTIAFMEALRQMLQ